MNLLKDGAATTAAYQVSDRSESHALAQFLQTEGQLPLSMVQLIDQAQLAVDEERDPR